MYGKYIGCIVTCADDVILLSGSVVKLRKMLDICYCNGSDAVFSAKNHHCLQLVKLMIWQLIVYIYRM